MIVDENHSSDEDSTAMESVNPDLGSKDIKFLKAVQEVNARNGYEPGTDERLPATTSKIAEVAGLNKNEVNYRLNQRGFDSDGLGYITVYGAQLLENGALSPKSAELTEQGEVALQNVLEASPSVNDGVESDIEKRLTELSDAVAELRNENQVLCDILQQIENSDTGAWSEDCEKEFHATLNAMVAHQRIFSEVFGFEVNSFRGEAVPTTAISRARDRLRERVTES